jgi:hypothetical protein
VAKLLTGVDVGVLLHVGLLVEALATELARVGSRVRVDQQVRGESGRTLEGLAALFALEHLLHVVNGPATWQQEALKSGSLLVGHSEV